jgi:hypothetical protein
VVTTAGSRTLVGIGRKLGSFDVSSNVFTEGGSVASPEHYSRLFAVVTTALSAAATNVTVTYTNEAGTLGRTTAALTIPASAPVGNCFEFTLQATTGQMRDNGVKDVTAISDTAAPTGVIEIWGVNPLHDTLGNANAYEVGSFDNVACSSDEAVLMMFQQAATTAQQRGALITGSVG